MRFFPVRGSGSVRLPGLNHIHEPLAPSVRHFKAQVAPFGFCSYTEFSIGGAA